MTWIDRLLGRTPTDPDTPLLVAEAWPGEVCPHPRTRQWSTEDGGIQTRCVPCGAVILPDDDVD